MVLEGVGQLGSMLDDASKFRQADMKQACDTYFNGVGLIFEGIDDARMEDYVARISTNLESGEVLLANQDMSDLFHSKNI